MAKTQKEISKRYEGNRSYYKLLHSFRRWKLVLAFASFGVGLLMLLFAFGFRKWSTVERFYNVGPISQSHAPIAHDCEKCHTPSQNRFSFMPVLSSQKALQAGCVHCHQGFEFHEANVVTNLACISCHKEHLGNGPMKAVADVSCTSCHGNSSIMAASRSMILTIPSRFLENVRPANLVFYPQPRLPDGYTKVIHSFDKDHPEFRLVAENMPTATAEALNRLKFDHMKHLSGNIPMVDGHKLDCNYCHKLDSTKSYMLPVSYEASCKACHSLQFDVSLAGLEIPHPQDSSDTVTNFLLTLPSQIEQYGRETLKIEDRNKLREFVFEKMSALRERTRRGDDLIQDVFYADNQRKSVGMVGSPSNNAPYPGCAYCHAVEPSSNDRPMVLKPLVPDRWLSRAKFDHSKHSTMSCEECHKGIVGSRQLSEISFPSQASCVVCHSAKGQVVSTCVTCHGYHHTPPEGLSTAQVGSPNGLLGKN